MKVKLVKSKQESAVIIVEGKRAFIIDLNLLPVQRVGETFEIEPAVLDTATPYGIDIDVIFPEGISVDMAEFQDRLFSYGIFSLDDLKKKPSVINQILISMVGGMGAEMYRQIKIVMEDYHDSI